MAKNPRSPHPDNYSTVRHKDRKSYRLPDAANGVPRPTLWLKITCNASVMKLYVKSTSIFTRNVQRRLAFLIITAKIVNGASLKPTAEASKE